MRALGVIANLMGLNILTLVCCIPIVTAGASFTAMHYVLLKIVRGEEGYIIKDFFKSFKENFFQATIIWIIVAAVYVALFLDWRIIRMQGDQFSGALIIALYAAILIVYLFSLYIFPVLSRYKNTIMGTFKMAFSLSVFGMLTLRTLAAGVLFLSPFALLYLFGYPIVPVILVFTFTGPGYFRAKLYNGLYKMLEKGNEETENQENEGDVIIDDAVPEHTVLTVADTEKK